MSTFVGTVQVFHVDADMRPSISFWNKVIVRVRLCWSHVRAGRQIQQLTDRQLRDIGMTRLQAEQHGTQPFRPLIQ